ncbi:MAG: hypothetical protein QNJ57_05555 [Flavobacteriaceae bacterium]|nr:hypothetical protein [Flavobacteriaceae bacterium]
MKTPVKLLSLCLIFIFVSATSCAQEKKEKEQQRRMNISFNNFSNNPDISSGFWTASKEGSTIYISLINSHRRNHGSFHINFSSDDSEFKKTADGFELDREAGVMKFQGKFPMDEGTGKFTFTRKSDFETFLKGKVLSSIDGDKDYYFFKLFLGDVTRAYVNGLKKLGYQPTMRQLGKLGIHDIDLEYITELRKTNYSDLDLDMIVKWAIHGVSLYYIDQLDKAGYGRIDANMVKKFAIHNITIDYINELSKAGYGNLEANMLKKFAIHKISPDYIKSLLAAKINRPDANTLKKAKIHNVTANFIEYARNKGHDSQDLHDYIKLKIRGV